MSGSPFELKGYSRYFATNQNRLPEGAFFVLIYFQCLLRNHLCVAKY